MIPVVLAVVIACMLDPLVTVLCGRRIPRVLGASLVLLALLAGVVCCAYLAAGPGIGAGGPLAGSGYQAVPLGGRLAQRRRLDAAEDPAGGHGAGRHRARAARAWLAGHRGTRRGLAQQYPAGWLGWRLSRSSARHRWCCS
ncbi:hypothetical protein ACU4GD_07845 [Cupriavidus basilensis]